MDDHAVRVDGLSGTHLGRSVCGWFQGRRYETVAVSVSVADEKRFSRVGTERVFSGMVVVDRVRAGRR